MDWFFQNESTIRLSAFLAGFVLFLLLGVLVPFRHIESDRRFSRWTKNIMLIFANSLLVRFALPISLVWLAVYSQENTIGVFNLLSLHPLIELALALVALDLMIYWQHRLFHASPLLWRLHRLHHSDVEFDVTTAGRFHPLEILLSFVIKLAAVILLGVSPLAIIVFELILNFSAMFNHSNFSFPARWETNIRRLIVTPAMHRIHHSVETPETNSNYGFCLSCWDKLFSSYRDKTSVNPQTMPIGLNEFRSPKDQTFLALILQPLRNPTSIEPANKLFAPNHPHDQ